MASSLGHGDAVNEGRGLRIAASPRPRVITSIARLDLELRSTRTTMPSANVDYLGCDSLFSEEQRLVRDTVGAPGGGEGPADHRGRGLGGRVSPRARPGRWPR